MACQSCGRLGGMYYECSVCGEPRFIAIQNLLVQDQKWVLLI